MTTLSWRMKAKSLILILATRRGTYLIGDRKPWELTAFITRTLAHESEANRATRRTDEQDESGQASGQRPASVYWLIARNQNRRLVFLALSLAGGEDVLSVFSSEEEAEMFINVGQQGGFESSGRVDRVRSVSSSRCSTYGCWCWAWP